MATNMNTNDLYQMIADNKAQADNVAQLAAGTPTFQENFGSTLRTQDKTLSSAVNNYGDAVAQLFAHDQSLASQVGGADTGIAPEGFVEDPYSRAMASANLYAEKGNMVASQLKTLENRKALLGDIVDKAVLMYKSAVEGKQLDYQANRDALSDALDVMKFEEQKRATAFSEGLATDEKTQKERFKKEALSQIEERARQGASIGQLFDEFASSGAVEMKDVMDIYKGVNYYKKPPEETSDRLARAWESAAQGLGHTDILGNLSAAERAAIQPKTAVVAQTNLILDRMKELSGGDPNFLDNFASGQFGIYRGINKKFNNDQVLRQILMRLTAKDRQEIFGSAFTTTEEGIAKNWLPDEKDLTNELWSKAVASMISNKANVDSYLLGRVSPEELQSYWDRQKRLQLLQYGNTSTVRNGMESMLED